MKWLMNPDNNPTMLLIAFSIIAVCVILSFAMVKP